MFIIVVTASVHGVTILSTRTKLIISIVKTFVEHDLKQQNIISAGLRKCAIGGGVGFSIAALYCIWTSRHAIQDIRRQYNPL